jgi:hypothetical protein
MTVASKKLRSPKAVPSPSGSDVEKQDGISDAVRNLISRKAYELWEQRGRQDGNALQDWLKAERIVREHTNDQVST